ncbi:MAG: hypothetical protein ACRDN9_04320 [Streptosporangiaceae bacterium]
MLLIVTPVVGAIGVVASVLLGHPVAGVTFCGGLLLGLVNNNLTMSSVARLAASGSQAKKPLMVSALWRLAAITAIALFVGFTFRPDGFAVLVGLAIFQFLLLGSASGALIREFRHQVRHG